jgi:hypothetical protein
MFTGLSRVSRVVPTQNERGRHSDEFARQGVLRSVVKQHPHKSPHTRACEPGFQGKFSVEVFENFGSPSATLQKIENVRVRETTVSNWFSIPFGKIGEASFDRGPNSDSLFRCSGRAPRLDRSNSAPGVYHLEAHAFGCQLLRRKLSRKMQAATVTMTGPVSR